MSELLSNNSSISVEFVTPLLARVDASGINDDASIKVNNPKMHSAAPLVLSTMKCIQKLSLSPQCVPIVESFVWIFVTRCLPSFMEDPRRFRRFISSVSNTALTIEKFVCDMNEEQEFCKFWIDTFMCRVSEDQFGLPPKPSFIKTSEIPPLFTGWCHRYVCRAVLKRDFSFIYSLQKGSKRLWPELTLTRKLLAYRKHALRLSTFPSSIKEEYLDVLRDVASDVWGKPGKFDFTRISPSDSACLQNTRDHGGSRFLFPKFEPKKLPVMGRLPSLVLQYNLWKRSTFSLAEEHAVPSLTGGDLFADNSLDALTVRVIAIAEPSKYRMITAGDGYLYTYLQPLQSFLLNRWKSSSNSTMRDDDLTDRVNLLWTSSRKFFEGFSEASIALGWTKLVMFSNDYEAATDLLNKAASLAAYPSHHSGFTSRMSTDGWLSLLSDKALYPVETDLSGLPFDYVEYGKKYKAVTLANGQFMGHPLSFPLLCVINRAVVENFFHALLIEMYKDYVDYHVRSRHSFVFDPQNLAVTFEVLRRHCLNLRLPWISPINGDDALLCMPERYTHLFTPIARAFGLNPSMGKNYVSPIMCQINSQLFTRTHTSTTWKRCGYLNLKVLSGFSVKTGESKSTPMSTARDLNKMATLTPWTQSISPAALGRWKSDWGGRFTPNWFLPVHLGGYGLDHPDPSSIVLTRDQRQVATLFIHCPELVLYRLNPNIDISGELRSFKKLLSYIPESGRLIIGDYVPQKHESFTSPHGFNEILAAMAHSASEPGSDDNSATEFSFFDVVQSYRKEPSLRRLKPMSKEGILRYWKARFLYTESLPSPLPSPVGFYP